MKKIIILIAIIFGAIGLRAQHSKPDTLRAYYCNEKIRLDGKLDEACWKNALPIENFTQREQHQGEPPTERTKVAVVYNENQIYFGIWCYDSEPDKISAQQMARDFSWRSDDNFEIMISPFNDNRNGYLFATNPNGALADVQVGDEGKIWNKDWNGVWDVAVDRNEEGWFIEMVIPFSTLKFKKEAKQVWGINFERNIRRKNEQLLWQGWSRLYDVERISQGGKLAGLENIKQGTKFEFLPYGLAGVTFGNDVDTDHTFKVGGEINYDVTPTLKLNLSINTDFAQVEADRKRINFSRFSLYYPEKRQFFLEGKNYYDMNVGRSRIFYSRRIGIDNFTEVPIIAGLRLFGKLNRTNIGLMNIQTAGKDDIATTNFTVIRVRQDIFNQSSIGVIATQKYTNEHVNRVFGTDLTYSTSKIFGNKNLLVGGQIAVSETSDDREEISNDRNLIYNIFLSYPNDIVEFDFAFKTVQKDFNPEMGFIRRQNYQMLYTELQFNPRFKKLPFFRNLIFKPLDINYYINDETKRLESIFYEWRPFGFVTRSGEFLEFNVQHLFDHPEEDFELVDGVVIPAGEYWDNRLELIFSSFKGRKISGSFEANVGKFYTGDRQRFELGTNFNINKHLNFNFDWQRNYVQLPGYDFHTDEIGGRVDYAFNPKLNTSIYAQYNTEDDDIVVNYRLNWIPKIGSWFYFVINQEFDTTNGIRLVQTTIMGKLIWRFAI